ncbi:helix-turn-helix domain-containing protein [Streptomyces chrestomyceticus]|uniref:helix-turn-helix domain-containing protein n=1 Tax=Streptomyces chrestomyceticus TaxID=68185 RepID=UPI00340B6104
MEISRGIAAGQSARQLARLLGRWPSSARSPATAAGTAAVPSVDGAILTRAVPHDRCRALTSTTCGCRLGPRPSFGL